MTVRRDLALVRTFGLVVIRLILTTASGVTPGNTRALNGR
jgi:hypothetical protein